MNKIVDKRDIDDIASRLNDFLKVQLQNLSEPDRLAAIGEFLLHVPCESTFELMLMCILSGARRNLRPRGQSDVDIGTSEVTALCDKIKDEFREITLRHKREAASGRPRKN
jgi:hypothetical protein